MYKKGYTNNYAEGFMGKKKKYKSAVYRSLAVITQFGINMLVPIFLCSFAGLYIDKKLGTGFWFVVLFFVGALAGFRNIYILAKKIYEGDEDGGKHD
jgi:F0F1-type ATP synthase assembly protein I